MIQHSLLPHPLEKRKDGYLLHLGQFQSSKVLFHQKVDRQKFFQTQVHRNKNTQPTPGLICAKSVWQLLSYIGNIKRINGAYQLLNEITALKQSGIIVPEKNVKLNRMNENLMNRQ